MNERKLKSGPDWMEQLPSAWRAAWKARAAGKPFWQAFRTQWKRRGTQLRRKYAP